jgi:hypothetical protein
MDRGEIATALRRLGELLEERGVQGDLYLVGGAALALAYDARRTTRDVDAVFEPKMVIYDAAAEVAGELGLPPDWLNDAARGFLYADDPHDGPVYDYPGLRVQAASAEMILAMKVVAARVGEDDDDVEWLSRHLGLRSAEEVMDVVIGIVGEERVGPRSRFLVEEVLREGS